MSNPLSDFLRSYLTVGIFASLGILLVGLLLLVSWLLRPDRRQEQKYMAYESGVDPIGDMWSQSQVRYYIFALLFVMFDVEAVFIFPWATQLEAFGDFGLVEMFVFIGILRARPRLRLAQGGAPVGLGLVESGKMPKPLTKLLNMSRKYSLWVYQWGLACCAIEMGAAFGSPRYDVMRLGVIPLPASPRQADLVVISGTVTDKMAPAILRLWRADARPQVRDLDGFLRQLRRALLGQLLGDEGRRPDHPRRRVRAGLSAPSRGAARGHRAVAGADPERGHGCPLDGRADRGRVSS